MNYRVGLALLLVWAPTQAAVYLVGPGMPYETPSAVAEVARDGDTIEIEMATYDGDVAIWTQNNLTIRGVGGRPHLRARGKSAEGKATWVIKGDNAVIENMEFSGARVSDRNGAGIRLEGTNLTVRNCYFHDNENGILTGEDPFSEVLVEYSEFANNGHGDGYSHNMYIGRIAKFTLQFSYIHHARIGHQVKSRAAENHIRFNRLMDEIAGTSSYLIDLPDPGTAYVVGNELQQGPSAENWAMVNAAQRVFMINNTLVNDRGNGVFVQLSGAGGLIQNNLFAGAGALDIGGARLLSNVLADKVGLINRVTFDYGLAAGSKAIETGRSVEDLDAAAQPDSEYVHPADGRRRALNGLIDIGAHERNTDP